MANAAMMSRSAVSVLCLFMNAGIKAFGLGVQIELTFVRFDFKLEFFETCMWNPIIFKNTFKRVAKLIKIPLNEKYEMPV